MAVEHIFVTAVTVCVSVSAGGPCLKCSEILKHVMDVLHDSYTCSAYGEDYSSLLVKDILSVRKYWCDIPPQQWHSEWEIHIPNILYKILFAYHSHYSYLLFSSTQYY